MTVLCILVAGTIFVVAQPGAAQYTKLSTPLNRASDSFFERMNVGFGADIHGAGFIRRGDAGPSGTIGLDPTGAPTGNTRLPFNNGTRNVVPQFGGYNAAGGANFGFGMLGSNLNTFTNLGFSQGSSRSFTNTTPTVVIPNGGQGTISDTIQRPFVTGVIPVVGGAYAPVIVNGYPPGYGYGWGRPVSPPVSPLFERIQQLNANAAARRQARGQAAAGARLADEPVALGGGDAGAGSTAEHGDLSVAEIRRRQATEEKAEDEELASWIERARGAEAEGKRNVARIYYRMAASRATGELRQELVEKYREMGDPQP
jgi:hypothetical protein